MAPLSAVPGNLFVTLTAILHFDWPPSPSVSIVDGRTLSPNFPIYRLTHNEDIKRCCFIYRSQKFVSELRLHRLVFVMQAHSVLY
jgi:hypothetical protein